MSLPKIDTKNLFDVSGKSALVVGATGAFGKVVCATLGNAGAKLTIAAGNGDSLNELEQELANTGSEVAAIAKRPNTETDCVEIVKTAVSAYGGIDILVVASGINEVAPITEMELDQFQGVMTANVDGPWLIARAVGKIMVKQGRGGKGCLYLIRKRKTGSSCRILGILYIKICS